MDGVQLAQPAYAMFERNIAHFAKKGREVEVWIEGIPDAKVGFIAGLDEEYLQLCLTDSANLSSVRRDMIISVDETGFSIGKLITSTKETDDTYRVDRIK